MLIAFCGIDGAGKTTLLGKVEKQLQKDNKVFRTKQPTDWYKQDSRFKSFISGNLEKNKFIVEELALLAATDRIRHINSEIMPKIEQGYIVLTDRYVFSSYSYMMARGIKDLKWLMQINKFAPNPDLTFYIDVPAEVAIKRIQGRDGKASKEEMNTKIMNKIREYFLSQPWGKNQNCHIIDNQQSIIKNSELILNIIKHYQTNWRTEK